MAKRILKQTETLAVVKVTGTNVTETFTLASDLLSSSMVVNGSPDVNISYVQWNVSPGASDTIIISRNAQPILNLFQNAGELDMGGNGGFVDDTNSTSDIQVQIIGTGDCFLTLRKAGGYKSKHEPETYGSYDNTTVVGS